MKNKIIGIIFVVLILGVIAYGAVLTINNINEEEYVFKTDGYAIYLKDNDAAATVSTFNNGTTYYYKKYNSDVSFETSDGNSTRLNEKNIIHYQNGDLMPLDNVVALDLTHVDDNIIFYYNIFKGTEMTFKDGAYEIGTSDSSITFNDLLTRVDDNRYLVAGKSVKALQVSGDIVDFGNYAYFEYEDGSVVKIYNNNTFYQALSKDIDLSVDNILIDLESEVILKDNVKYITLSNLVIDKDGNIDVIVPEDEVIDIDIEKPDVGQDILDGPGEIENPNNNNSGTVNEEEEEDTTVKVKEPTFKVTSMLLTALKLDATIEITDEFNLISSPTTLTIVENATSTKVYEETTEQGDLYGYVSAPNLKPDTEYTLYATASYKMDEVEYKKSFVNKIFRTESLGVSYDVSYVTSNSVVLNLTHEKYSKVSSVVIGIYNMNGDQVDYKNVSFTDGENLEVTFNNLTNNTTYMVKMYDILCAGLIVDDGYSVKENVTTLKRAPYIGDLTYAVNKANSTFELEISKINDPDYGITNYRYEVYDSRQNITEEEPTVTVERSNFGPATVKVDDTKIYHGIGYTYCVVVEFNDNEKDIEYSSCLGSTMQLDGVVFPTVRWQETKVTWEQINGTIIIDDPAGTIMSNNYKIVYKNSVDVYESMSITAETSTYAIPININYLRANETYTFDVYASINLQDGNTPVTEAYIGSVKVQTQSPNPLHAVFGLNESYSDVFSISFHLEDDNGNAALEANTIQSLMFTLYQGATTDGMVEVYKRVIDTNSNEYVSSIKSMFYDAIGTIDATFFDSENSDFNQKVYTLTVTNAYDYTGYDSNIIPIKDNVFKFEVSNYLPQLPDDSEIQIISNPIYNKNASAFDYDFDTSLEANTVIGYNIVANYNNSSKLAQYVIYHVYRYNHLTDKYELIPTLDEKVFFKQDGSLPMTFMHLENGTDNSTVDSDKLRRGNKYYFTFEAFLDIDGNGVPEFNYPKDIDENAVLRSDYLSPPKQSSAFKIYPSSSDATTFTWNYKIMDVDNAMFEPKLYAYLNADDVPVSTADINLQTTTYAKVKLTDLEANKNVTIKKKEQYIKGGDTTQLTLASQYFYGYNEKLNLSYTVKDEVNRIILSIDDYFGNTSKINSIAKVKVVITPVNEEINALIGSKELDNLTITEGDIVIDYYDIAEYLNYDVRLKLIVYYDTGGIGFDYPNVNGQLIQKGSYGEVGNYYYLFGAQLRQTSNAFGNLQNAEFDSDSEVLNIYDDSLNEKNFTTSIDHTGVVYQDNNIFFKEVKEEILSSDDDIIQFSATVPGISLMHGSNRLDITAVLDVAYVNATIITVESCNIQDNLIYIDLYETNSEGNTSTYLNTMRIPVSDFEESVMISNLSAKKNYYIRFYAYVYDNIEHGYKKIYLYDTDQKTQGVNYYFHTLSDVGVNNINGYITSTSYLNKTLTISYSLDTITGYDSIEYKLYKLVDGAYVNTGISIPVSKSFYKNMNVTISARPGSNINYGDTFKIVIIPKGHFTLNGVRQEIELGTKEGVFALEQSTTPTIGISGSKTDESIIFRVTVNDTSNIIADGVYSYELTDSYDHVIASGSDFSISEINKRFVFDKSAYSLVQGETYTFTVRAKLDRKNNGIETTFINMERQRSIQYGGEISLGTVVISDSGVDDDSFNLVFSESFQLNLINTVSYTITDVNTGFYRTATEDFVARHDITNNLDYFTVNLFDLGLTPNTMYTITFNFFHASQLVESLELDYFYVGGSS